MMYYCLVCGEEFEVNGFEQCPHCMAVGDDLEAIEDMPEVELTDEDIDDMYERYIANAYISNRHALIGAQ